MKKEDEGKVLELSVLQSSEDKKPEPGKVYKLVGWTSRQFDYEGSEKVRYKFERVEGPKPKLHKWQNLLDKIKEGEAIRFGKPCKDLAELQEWLFQNRILWCGNNNGIECSEQEMCIRGGLIFYNPISNDWLIYNPDTCQFEDPKPVFPEGYVFCKITCGLEKNHYAAPKFEYMGDLWCVYLAIGMKDFAGWGYVENGKGVICKDMVCPQKDYVVFNNKGG